MPIQPARQVHRPDAGCNRQYQLRSHEWQQRCSRFPHLLRLDRQHNDIGLHDPVVDPVRRTDAELLRQLRQRSGIRIDHVNIFFPARPPIKAVAMLPPPIKLIFKSFRIIPLSKNGGTDSYYGRALGYRRVHVRRHPHRQGIQSQPLRA